MAHIIFEVKLLCFFIFFAQSSYADRVEDCNLKDLKESVRKIDHAIDRLQLNEGEEDLKETKINLNGKISDILQNYSNIPQDCLNASSEIDEFVRDIKLIKRCSENPSNSETVNLFDDYKSSDASYFKERLSCAEGITPLDKQAEMFRALTRISFLSDFETNQKFYNQLKDLIVTADSTVSNILIEAMKTLIAKTVKIGCGEVRPELLLDLYAFDKLAGKQAIEMIAVDMCDQYGEDCFIIIDHVSDVSLRAYAYLAFWSLDTNSEGSLKKAKTAIVIPHLEYIMKSEEFEHLDEDLKNEINKVYNDAPEWIKTLIKEGEVCLAYVKDEFTTTEPKPNIIYLKSDDNGTMTDWKFIENSEGDIKTQPTTHPRSKQLFLPSNVKTPEFWSGNVTHGNWEMAPDGTDCDFNEETYNIYVCRNLGSFMRSPDRSVRYFKGDQIKIQDINSRRLSICGE